MKSQKIFDQIRKKKNNIIQYKYTNMLVFLFINSPFHSFQMFVNKNRIDCLFLFIGSLSLKHFSSSLQFMMIHVLLWIPVTQRYTDDSLISTITERWPLVEISRSLTASFNSKINKIFCDVLNIKRAGWSWPF